MAAFFKKLVMAVSPQDLLDTVNAFDLGFEVEEAFNETAKAYTDLQREQLFSGINEQGDQITPEYSPRTVAIKRKKGQPTDRVTLRDTGDFYQGIFMDPREDIYVIDSADEKSGALQKKYGEEIFGLAPKNQDTYVEQNLEPVFMDRVHKSLQL